MNMYICEFFFLLSPLFIILFIYYFSYLFSHLIILDDDLIKCVHPIIV